jgi:hypothetical protein
MSGDESAVADEYVKAVTSALAALFGAPKPSLRTGYVDYGTKTTAFPAKATYYDFDSDESGQVYELVGAQLDEATRAWLRSLGSGNGGAPSPANGRDHGPVEPTASSPPRARPRGKASTPSALRMRELHRWHRILAGVGRSTAKVDAIIAAGGDIDRNGWQVGAEMGFTLDDYRLYRRGEGEFPRTLRPINAKKLEIAAVGREFNNVGAAARLQSKRVAERRQREDEAAAIVQAADLDCRGSAVFTVLSSTTEKTLADLMNALAASPAFRSADDNRFLSGNSLRVAILLRELKKPALAAMIEVRIETVRGFDRQMIRRGAPGLFGRQPKLVVSNNG